MAGQVPKLTKREWRLGLHLNAERVLANFLRNCARPRLRYNCVEKALEEINHERLILQAQMRGDVPRRRRRRVTRNK